jgi:DNA modification methylase
VAGIGDGTKPATQSAETEAKEDDFDPDAKFETKVQKGDVWQLGNHRLMCGDSTKAEDVAKLMNGERAVMTFSDAPYNVDFKGSMSNTTVNGVMVKHKGANTRHEAIHNDKMNKDDFFNFMMKILENIKANVTGAWYLSFSSVNLEELLNPLRASGMDWKSIIIWMKNQATLSMKDYKSRYEPIVYGRFNDAWYGNRGFEEDIWEYQRTLKNDLHPTMKPVPLIGKMVQDGSKEGGIVLDLFGGSGSTMIACEQLKRKCMMMELDPHYCTVIINRWEQLTGQKAERL